MPQHVGFLSVGGAFGEVALVCAGALCPHSVVAGEGGVLLATLQRAAYARLVAQAAHQVGAGLSRGWDSCPWLPAWLFTDEQAGQHAGEH